MTTPDTRPHPLRLAAIRAHDRAAAHAHADAAGASRWDGPC